MMLFPETLLHIGIVSALVLTGIGALTLLILLVRDFMKGEVW
jgi:hypothetical protein